MPRCPRCQGCLQLDIESGEYAQFPELLCRSCGRRWEQRTPPPVFEIPAKDLLPCYMRVCRLCGKAFKRHRPDIRLYCGAQCSKEALRQYQAKWSLAKYLSKPYDQRRADYLARTPGTKRKPNYSVHRDRAAAQVGQTP